MFKKQYSLIWSFFNLFEELKKNEVSKSILKLKMKIYLSMISSEKGEKDEIFDNLLI